MVRQCELASVTRSAVYGQHRPVEIDETDPPSVRIVVANGFPSGHVIPPAVRHIFKALPYADTVEKFEALMPWNMKDQMPSVKSNEKNRQSA